MSQVTAVIAGAGRSVRMKGTTPKQYLKLQDQPILTRTIGAFNECRDVDNILLVVPEGDVQFCEDQILKPIALEKPIQIITGGSRRQDSVFKGLQAIQDRQCIVVVHDGVRPFIQSDKISTCSAGARECGACILGVPLTDTLKSVDSSKRVSQTIDRRGLWLAQTPQSFQYALLRDAHESALRDDIQATDDAALVERLGITVKIVKGDRHNIKITTKESQGRDLLEKSLQRGVP